MYSYREHVALEKHFYAAVGPSGSTELPVELLGKLAGFIDAHPDDWSTAYDVRKTLDKFYRKRSPQRSARLVATLTSQVRNKRILLDVFLRDGYPRDCLARAFCADATALWQAISGLEDGYDKANRIGDHAAALGDAHAGAAYAACHAMAEPYRTRALAGLHSRMDGARKSEILTHIAREFVVRNTEAVWAFKRLFPFLDPVARHAVVSLHLDGEAVPESWIARLAIRNAAYLEPDDADRIVARARSFDSSYLRNRCLLKLAGRLPDGEVQAMYARFMEDFRRNAPDTASIHNLYQFAAALKLDRREVVALALDSIARLVDAGPEVWNQRKYGHMLFILPLLDGTHAARAFEISRTVRGGYGRTLVNRLNRHFSGEQTWCRFLLPGVLY